jgi:adenine-specific DNA-methyltransferase
MDSRLSLAVPLLNTDGLFFSSIDEKETARLRELGEKVFGSACFAADLVWNTQHSQQSGLFTPYHEYVQVFGTKPSKEYSNFVGGRGEIIAGAMKKVSRANPACDFAFPAGVRWEAPEGTELKGKWGKTEQVELVKGRMVCRDGKTQHPVVLRAGWTQKRQMERFFGGERPVLDSKGQEVVGFFFNSTGKLKIVKKRTRLTPKTILPEFGTVSQATAALAKVFGREVFGRPKPTSMMEYLIGLTTADSDNELAMDFFAGSGTTGHAVINLNREDGGSRKFILVEMGDYFDTVLLPRLKKVTFSPEWKDGKPKRLATPEEAERSPRVFKVVRLESYEDALNNLELKRDEAQQSLLDQPSAQGPDGLREQYILRYLLDVESRGSASLLNISRFTDPRSYTLKVKGPGSDESREVAVDLVETFNWLLGLKVRHLAAPQTFSAGFKRDDEGRLRIDGRLKREPDGAWWFRTVEGEATDGRKVLVIWRTRPGGDEAAGIEQDNLVLDEWFTRQGYSAKDSEFDLIYVNGDNNLENLKDADDCWKVRLIEEEFFRLMFDVEDV